jgi:DNA invertase Pin-like site-specific DNA recombinase
MALVGYARVSSVGQSLEVQRDKLKHFHQVYFRNRRVGLQINLPDKRPAWNLSGQATPWW